MSSRRASAATNRSGQTLRSLLAVAMVLGGWVTGSPVAAETDAAKDARWPQVEQVGQSVDGRPIEAAVYGTGDDVLLVLATIHGNEAAGTPLLEAFARWLSEHPDAWRERQVVLIHVANPDGMAADRRTNLREVDLNRNFPAGNWTDADGKPHGPTPLSEPESRALMRVICQYFPDRVVSIHQPLACVDYDGPGKALAEAMAAHCSLPVRKLGGRPGSLGTFVGEVLERPIITLELPRDAPMDGEQLWRQYGKALIAALEYQTPGAK